MARIPLGFRFAPTDQDLIIQYLRRKVKGESLSSDVIIEREIYDKSPWDVFQAKDPWHTTNKDKREFVIYAFTRLKKIGAKKRALRRVGCGTWDGQTQSENIYNRQKQLIGVKKMLVFEANVNTHECSIMPRGHWIMHEYSLDGVSLDGLGKEGDRDYVVCKIKRDDSKFLKRATKRVHGGGHGRTIDDDDDHGCMSSLLGSHEENPTHKKMRYVNATLKKEKKI
ncbi:NAC domain-containing protein 83-like [Cornus florida]|uniref:NAC domain-containing protein 83-like n=1 Tax=Cornus florida TaxID=4283 RepID=UPI0028975040|nr:NAC domain-containing protein 83-like [Cornus florida]